MLVFPELDEVLSRWASARLAAHNVIGLELEVTERDFLEVFRSCEDIPLLVARVRRAEGFEVGN